MESPNPDPVSIGLIEHYAYCPRQYALIDLEQAFEDNVHTQRGQAAHQRVDAAGVRHDASGVLTGPKN